ncbi:hypothetical protein OG893_15185 [Streptomyces sp. NBC_01696]|uniref:hypothetical protein n=1 Tax=Streptomyces sp. NBC_01696 TaxID=2975913 RepID=UPI002E34A803|nr:hypothetical protein [Streptomyces sp. NBC_01696]
MSEPWFHKWRNRRLTERELRRQRLANEIKEIFILLVRKGWRVSMSNVAKLMLMAKLGLVGRDAEAGWPGRGNCRLHRTSPSGPSPPRNPISPGRAT